MREDYERAAGHIAGSRHIALGDLAAEAESLDRERPVIFHCHVGSRSLMAAQAFRQAGFEAYSMAGGLEAWEQEGRPVQTAAPERRRARTRRALRKVWARRPRPW